MRGALTVDTLLGSACLCTERCLFMWATGRMQRTALQPHKLAQASGLYA